MANEIFVFDALASGLNGEDTGSPLLIGPGTNYLLRKADFPAPPQSVTYAGTVDTEGSIPASRKHENRQISLTITCVTAAALRALQAKIAKVAREGGTLKWNLPNAEVGFFDLHAADTFSPTFDVEYQANAGAYCEVQIVLLGRPYLRGAEITLADHVETALPALVFTETLIKGDMPGTARFVVDNDQATAQVFLHAGIQSRYYDAASTAALYYEAEACALINGTLTSQVGASGGGNNVVQNTNPGSPDLSEICYIGASSTAQTHIGTFKIFARVYAPNTNTGLVSVYAKWVPTIGAQEITNDAVDLTDAGVAQENKFLWIDLGMVSLPKARRGSQGWLGKVCNTQTVAADKILVDCIALFPVDEAYAEASAFTGRNLVVATTGSVEISDKGILATSDGARWHDVDIPEGDNLLLPASGAEARTLRVIAKYSRMVPARADDFTTTSFGDAGVDDISGRLFYTPRYLVVPSP